MLPLLLLLTAATTPVTHQQAVSVQVNGGRQFCGHVYATPGSPQVGLDAGRDFAADQTSLRLQIAGVDVLAPNMSAPYGIVLLSLDASNALAQKKMVTFRYTIHQGKDTVTATFPAAAVLGCK